MITTVGLLLITGSLLNIEQNWIWDKYSLFTDGPYESLIQVTRVAPAAVAFLQTLVDSSRTCSNFGCLADFNADVHVDGYEATLNVSYRTAGPIISRRSQQLVTELSFRNVAPT